MTNSLKLDHFHGATLAQICIGALQQQFHFIDPELHLSIEGDWHITNAVGDLVDRSLENGQRPQSVRRIY